MVTPLDATPLTFNTLLIIFAILIQGLAIGIALGSILTRRRNNHGTDPVSRMPKAGEAMVICHHEEVEYGVDGYGIPGMFCRFCFLVVDRPPTTEVADS